MNRKRFLAALCLWGISSLVPAVAFASDWEADAAAQAIGRLGNPPPANRSASDSGSEGMRIVPEGFGVRSVTRDSRGWLRIVLDGDFGPAPRYRENAQARAAAGLHEELLMESIAGALLAADVDAPHEVLVADGSGNLRPLGDISTDEERQERREQNRRVREELANRAPAKGTSGTRSLRLPKGGALLGKRIAISPGHGWENDGGWRYQRSNCRAADGLTRGIQEDLFTNDFVSRWLVPLLENMGAEVILAREIDHGDGGYLIINNGDTGYSESGSGWADGSNSGGWESDYRVSNAGDAKASFLHTFSTSGWRRMSSWFLHGTNRTGKATFKVKHAGGETPFDVDQTMPGKFFLDMGNYWCAAGVPCGLELSNGAGSGYLIADAVKMGGGPYAYSGSSTKPLWHMAAMHYLGDLLGKSPLVNDVQARPRFTEMIGADVFLSVHSNAAGSDYTNGSTAHGISTYRYNCKGASNEGASSCDDPPGSKKLSNSLHQGALKRIRSDWDPNFCDRSERMDNFGEVRELDDTPGVLMEVAFHDNLKTPQQCSGTRPKMTDNLAMHDPRWREALAYGLADGFGAYFGTGKAPPVRPTGIRAVNGASPCSLTVSWKAVSGATAYRLYRIDNVRPGYERAFDAGTVVNGTSTTLTDLRPGRIYAFKVAAMDANGESYPSAAVAARVLSAGERVEGLYVNGYDRRDSYVQEIDNDLGYAAEHAIALSGVGSDFYFDGTTKDFVEDGTLPLSGYAVVDYQAGRNSTEHHAVSAAMQQRLTSYLGAGGKLFISGDDIGFDLGGEGNGTAFLSSSLKAGFSSTNAGASSISGSGPFAGLSKLTIDDGSHGTYEEKSPDALQAASGGTVVMTYDSKSSAAAIEGPNTILLGVPLETIYPDASRAKVAACGIGRLLKGASWTCSPASVSVPAGGAPEGVCSLPPDPPEPDAGISDAGHGEDGGDGGGVIPHPEDAGGQSEEDASAWDAASSGDASSVFPDEDASGVIDPLTPASDAGFFSDPGQQPGSSGVFVVESGCASSGGGSAPWTVILSVLSLGIFPVGRRRVRR